MNETKIKACCGFGHRQVFENITELLESAINSAADQGCKIFYTGAMGDFDSLFSSAVRKAKANHPDIKLICIKPYMTRDINENCDFLYSFYDDIIIPTELAYVHYKSAITKRNELMIKWSDWTIVYHIHNYGGAYRAELFAKKNNKTVLRITL